VKRYLVNAKVKPGISIFGRGGGSDIYINRLCVSIYTIGLHVEYAEGRITYGILFIYRLFYEYSNLEYVHIYVIYRVSQAKYVLRIRVAASQEYVNTYSTRRTIGRALAFWCVVRSRRRGATSLVRG